MLVDTGLNQDLEQARAEELLRNKIQEAKQQQQESEAKKRTFDFTKLIPAAIAAPFTGGSSLALATIGEGARAATGSDTDIAGLAQQTAQFLPKPSYAQAVQETGIKYDPSKGIVDTSKTPSLMDRLGSAVSSFNPLEQKNWQAPTTYDEKQQMAQKYAIDQYLRQQQQEGKVEIGQTKSPVTGIEYKRTTPVKPTKITLNTQEANAKLKLQNFIDKGGDVSKVQDMLTKEKGIRQEAIPLIINSLRAIKPTAKKTGQSKTKQSDIEFGNILKEQNIDPLGIR